MSSDWIYVGAERERPGWCKIGKTTRGLHARHTSSHNPWYLIYAGFRVYEGNVHEIEYELLEYLRREYPDKQQFHFSTGSESECFFINPYEMECIVEEYLENNYSRCFRYNHVMESIRRRRCPGNVHRWYMDRVPEDDDPLEWSRPRRGSFPEHLSMNKNNYFEDTHAPSLIDLGGGHYQDVLSGEFGCFDDEDDEEY